MRRAVLVGACSLLAAFGLVGSAGGTLPGRNGRLYFTVSPGGFGAQISWIDVNRPRKVHVVRWLAAAAELTWAPSGKRLVYSTPTGLFVANADGSARRRLTTVKRDSGVIDVDPAWSPDGRWIAFTHLVPMHPTIFLMRPNGTNRHELTAGQVPSWSPRGRELVFQGGDVNQPHLYLIAQNGSRRRQITRSSGSDNLPDWSPDGKQILFVSDRDGNEELYLTDATGARLRRLTRNPAYDTTPAWSPDVRWIVFAEGHNRKDFALYLVRPDGTAKRRLTPPGVDAQVPSWQPLPQG